MGQWVVTVAGIAILSVLCDVILPEGQTRKYVRTVLGIVVTLVIVQPIVGLLDGDFDLWNTETETEVQQQYLAHVEDRQNAEVARSVQTLLLSNGVSPVEVRVCDGKIALTLSRKESSKENTVKSVMASHFSRYELSIVWT